jgi:hypothetical protein
MLAAYYATARRPLCGRVLLAGLAFYSWWTSLSPIPGQSTATGVVELYRRTGGGLAGAGIAVNFASLASSAGPSSPVSRRWSAEGAADSIAPHRHSFFTFQPARYPVDAARRRTLSPAARHPVRALFPHLIAARSCATIRSCPSSTPTAAARCPERPPGPHHRLRQEGVPADLMARFADPIFATAATSTPSLVDAWHGALAFSFQLFLDFSAYSEMAIGLGLMLGVRFPDNFDMPYRASDLANFWRRWHMTLSQLIRDYLYIPLGGSRHGWGTYVKATLLSMGLCGLWHGAGWTYVAWGLMHGVGLVVCRAWQRKAFPLPAAVGWALTMLFVLVGWVLFRSPDFATAGHMLKGMAGWAAPGAHGPARSLAVALIARCWCPPPIASSKAAGCSPSPGRGLALLLVACIPALSGQLTAAFTFFSFETPPTLQ